MSQPSISRSALGVLLNAAAFSEAGRWPKRDLR
eukprot:CAMPEP_0206325942 /NCGR_PEP_ID=MMETSP0106_2-20121207/21345_1 /ASSEMBLY_ACC=CAM_ASM_000206 /TAXON_ID=81532 /ORGANISM="Acanthoeca-like sp., Strain 10tr" /LENGTH=32 /DNA_ID= /DNA_START= /DNA_END= /DNA_ORIENTATION=